MKLSASIIAMALAQAVCTAAAPHCHRKHRSSAAAAPAPTVQAAPVAAVSPASSAVPSQAPAQLYAAPSQAPAQSSAAPAAAAASPVASAGSSPLSGGKPMIDSINVYRSKANLPLFTWNDTLADNSYKTCKDANGTALVHELNPGSYGQVLVFGFDDADVCNKNLNGYTPFEVFWYSWLCEVPDDPALGGICPTIWDTGHINSAGQTGHHAILANPDYKTIGCGYYRNPAAPHCDEFPGVWGCDVGY